MAKGGNVSVDENLEAFRTLSGVYEKEMVDAAIASRSGRSRFLEIPRDRAYVLMRNTRPGETRSP